jgi:hypothetical protein
MSNFLAIATATATFQALLSAAVQQAVPGAEVTTERPDRLSDQQAAHVNAYLYQVTPNPAWRNADLPTRQSNGQIVQRPCAALDLYYLLSFYGDESTLEPQRLLGSVARRLHAEPILDRGRMAEVIESLPFLNGSAPANGPRSNLEAQPEQVKFVPHALSLEELSKLWSVFFQTPYALSVLYQASVVLIEADETPPTALPVRERNVYAVPSRQPVITAVETQVGANQPIVAGSTLVMRGSQLSGEDTLVRVDDMAPVAPESVTDTAISLPLGDDLRAGAHSVQVLHQILMGTPETPHLGVSSNVAAFVLQPAIAEVSLGGPQTLIIELIPQVDPDQRVEVLLNTADPVAASAQSFSIPANTFEGVTSVVTFDVSGVAAGDYLVRVRVDGATSALEVDTDENSPTFNRFIAPQVTFP